MARVAAKSGREWSSGSWWLRWDPHIHCPGTLKADEFKDDWAGYFAAIESARPKPVALGITDYFSLSGYKQFRDRRPPGAFPWVSLIFPNVEMRLTTPTRKGGAINVHVLFSPDDPDHVQKIEAHLSELTWKYEGRKYQCTDPGLIALGRATAKNSSLPIDPALREGAEQFKVEFSSIVALFDDDWVRENAQIAIAAGEDGLAGLSKDSGFRAFREEMARASHIIFSGNPQERAFWLSDKPDKPKRACLHGSDAHFIERVLNPVGTRRCWIRGDATFESLRQTVMEPERRAFIGPEPPRDAAEGYVIQSLQLANAPWIDNTELTLNDGLVTVIGAKGSGKTALADLIALIAGADEPNPGSASFIRKARSRIGGLKGTLTWGDNGAQSAVVQPTPQPSTEPRVQYLSQQFVERLSGPQDIGEPLVEEIERVVFNAIPDEDRLQTSSFAELRDIVLEDSQADRTFQQENVRAYTRAVSDEHALRQSISEHEAKLTGAERTRAAIKRELDSIPAAGSAEKGKAHAKVSAALQTLQTAIAAKERRAQEIADVRGEVQRQIDGIRQSWDLMRQAHPGLLDPALWDALLPRVPASAVQQVVDLEEAARREAADLRDKGLPPEPGSDPITLGGLDTLRSRLTALENELGLDKTNANRKADLERRLTTAKTNEEVARKELAHARGAADRQKEAFEKRLTAYSAVFETLRHEERELARLYAPLVAGLKGTKLRFSVVRAIDLEAWVSRGEELIDMRHSPFSNRDYLADQARTHLLEAWETGSAEDVRRGMRRFLEVNGTQALEALTLDASPMDLGEWLFSTDHIRIRYGIKYEGVELGNLSPGTRGLVLLTLYLRLDQWDLRPLIIDQPEENLDPSSVYSELVPFFRQAARRRQIIMVTHNANLVVNTDSDQVIVATSVRHRPKDLPQVTYYAGGLENPDIREDVCSLLEGGRDAFRVRGQRYGMRLS